MAIDWGNDPAVIPAQDIDRIGEIAMRHRDDLVDELVLSFPDRDGLAGAAWPYRPASASAGTKRQGTG